MLLVFLSLIIFRKIHIRISESKSHTLKNGGTVRGLANKYVIALVLVTRFSLLKLFPEIITKAAIEIVVCKMTLQTQFVISG